VVGRDGDSTAILELKSRIGLADVCVFTYPTAGGLGWVELTTRGLTAAKLGRAQAGSDRRPARVRFHHSPLPNREEGLSGSIPGIRRLAAS
jgi:hypothetical protein